MFWVSAYDAGCHFGHHCCWRTSPNPIKHRGQSMYTNFYINWLSLTKSFLGGAEQHMCMAFGKRQNGERKPVLVLVPCSHKRLASRKRVMHARNMGVYVWCGTRRTKGIKKRDEKLDSCAAEKGAKKLVSSDCAKILEKESSDQDWESNVYSL